MVGTKRGEKLSRHSCSPSKRHLWPGCPWSGDLGAELGWLGAGAEQPCPGPPVGSVLCGLQAPGWRPLCVRHAGAIPKHAPAQPWKRCQPAGSVLPTDFACSSYFPLLSLALVKEPAPGFVCLNPPCAKLLWDPWFWGGGRNMRAALVSPSQQLSPGEVVPLRLEFLRARFFPSLPTEMPPSWTPPCSPGCLCPPRGCPRLPAQVP